MDKKKRTLEIAKFIIKNNASISEVCEEFGISRRTAQIYTNTYLKEYAETDSDLKELYDRVELIKQVNQTRTSKNIDLEVLANSMILYNLTVEETALRFDVSESTIHNYIKQIKETNISLYNKVKYMQDKLSRLGKYVGGKNGVRESKYTDFEVLEIAETMVSSSLTLDEAALEFGIPRSSVYECIKRVNDKELSTELDNLFEYNKHKSSK